MLPSKSVFNQHIEDAGLTLVDTLSFGRDYARTLSAWNRRFQKAWPTFTNLSFDDRFKKLWEQYLCYCEAGFNVGSIDVIQAEISKTE
jgi:cyclopropane-fatty-acyl-phospholipid synthase